MLGSLQFIVPRWQRNSSWTRIVGEAGAVSLLSSGGARKQRLPQQSSSMPVLYNYLSPESLPSRRTSTSSPSLRNSSPSLAPSQSRACNSSLPLAELCLRTSHHLHSSLSRPIRVMASSSVMRTAVVVMAVVSSVAVLASAAAVSPAPAPQKGAGFSLVPSIVAPVLGMVVAFFASRVLC